ncbi:uncharacterized protein F4822DRAFT_302859 [Hypoxylon trugodes]|uniref:uncharacterized protein n=1 Tax=Hypoxylon trugodes TaxID=326681 RepID=UPI0021939279|nr:uncharacterized protein F4822DRAFT_302859 [Hypoxylon trugodes]KAI1388120.1 hypothetical protein F4822DRAFT_302859 [Hypoxylon trugodes]
MRGSYLWCDSRAEDIFWTLRAKMMPVIYCLPSVQVTGKTKSKKIEATYLHTYIHSSCTRPTVANAAGSSSSTPTALGASIRNARNAAEVSVFDELCSSPLLLAVTMGAQTVNSLLSCLSNSWRGLIFIHSSTRRSQAGISAGRNGQVFVFMVGLYGNLSCFFFYFIQDGDLVGLAWRLWSYGDDDSDGIGNGIIMDVGEKAIGARGFIFSPLYGSSRRAFDSLLVIYQYVFYYFDLSRRIELCRVL